MVHTVIKRNGEAVAYDRMRIRNAINKANAQVDREYQANDTEIDNIIIRIETKYADEEAVSVEEIQDIVVQSLLQNPHTYNVGIKYHDYRNVRSAVRGATKQDKNILSIVQVENEEVSRENANKNATLASTQRDLIAGEVSKDMTMRVLLPEKIAKAHNEGAIHFHDADYFLQPIFNCCLINVGDMLDNGFVMNDKLIESPKSFQVACTVMTQIIASVASSQYGGQSIDIRHLGKYLRKSYEKYLKKCDKPGISEETKKELALEFLRSELSAGVQTIQYQINTLMTTNGQSPFVTIFLNLQPDDEYAEENAMIIEEILNQRIVGIKNEKGIYITPAFPKLIYVLDEHNCLKGGKYDYLTKLAVKCSAKRMYPDYISAKKMRENYEGNVFSPMGCRSFLSVWKDENDNYKWEGRFNQGVVSLNLPQIAILSKGDELKFWQILEERLALCFEALMCRHKALLGTPSDISPIHFQYGAIARLNKGEKIDKLLKDGYSTLSLGYIGVYEMCKLMTGESHTTKKGEAFALKVMNFLRNTTERWKTITGLGFGLYGTPAESLCYRFARIDKERFGEIPDVTDKGYYTNSYHVDVREKIDAFTKLSFESQFQSISSGGAISYVEIPNLTNNLDAIEEVVGFIYDNIQYAEFNTKSDYCHVCNYEGEIIINDEGQWECPQCHNKDTSKMNISRRVCGYLGGDHLFNKGKTMELKSRVLHLGTS